MEVKSAAEQLLFTTLRIETTLANGENRVGTGFVFEYPHEQQPILRIVTNKHVVEGAVTGYLTFTRSVNDEPSLGDKHRLEISDFERSFVGHPDPDIDVAVGPFMSILQHLKGNGFDPFFRTVPSGLIPTDDALDQLDALEDVVFIGYPNGIWDTVNNLPILRRGITATPIAADFMGRPQFLIDASVFPGSSGSPVFLYNAGMYAQKSGATVVGGRLYFLGLVSEVFYRSEEGKIELRTIPTREVPLAVTREMIDLGLVFKAKTVVEAIQNTISP